MDLTIILAVAALLGTPLAALATYLVARRTGSGKINTTEASVLWTENTDLRRELRTEVVQLRAQVDVLRGLNEELRIDNARLRAELDAERARH